MKPAGLPMGQHLENVAATLAAAVIRNRNITDAALAVQVFMDVVQAINHSASSEE